MSGTPYGGRRAANTNKMRYGVDFYKKIGAKGGSKGTTGGFYYSAAHGLNTHIEAGRKGGTISRKRGPNKKVVEDDTDNNDVAVY